MSEVYHSPYEACPQVTERAGEALKQGKNARENGSAVLYRSEFEAYPFLADSDTDIRCDFEIHTDRMSSMAGVIASMCPERREEILKVDELIYHANPTLRTFMSITDEEIEWLHERLVELKSECDAANAFPETGTKCRTVLPAGTTRGAYAHVLRVEGKQMVRILYRARERGIEFPNSLIDFANLVSGYFHMLGIWMNMKDGFKEIPFVSRNYTSRA